MRPLLRTLLVSAMLITLTLTALFLAVVQWPSLVFNPHTLALFQDRLPWAHWRDGRTEAASLTFWKKRIVLEFTDACTTGKIRAFEACFRKVEISAEVDFRAFPPRLERVERLVLSGGKLAIHPSGADPAGIREQAPPPKASRSEQKVSSFIPRWLRDTEFGTVRIELPQWSFQTSSGRASPGQPRDTQQLSGTFLLASSPSPAGLHWNIHLVERLSSPLTSNGAANTSRLDAILSSRSPALRGPWVLDLDAIGRFRKGLSVQLRSRLATQDFSRIQYDLDANYREKRLRSLTARIAGSFAPRHIEATITGNLRNFIPDIPKLEVQNCRVQLNQEQEPALGTEVPGRFSGRLQTDCPVLAEHRLNQRELIPSIQLPTTIKVGIQADLRTKSFIPKPAEPVDGTLSLELAPIHTDLLEGNGRIQARFSGIPAEFPRNGELDTRLDAAIDVPEVMRVSRALSRTRWFIPAPLNTMEGRLRIAVTGGLDLNQGILPVSLQTRLSSKHQRFDLDGSGILRLARTAQGPLSSMDFDLTLSNVQLALPRLDLAEPPQIVPDKRIHTGLSKASLAEPPTPPTPSKRGVQYRINIKTPPGHPVRLLSNLTRAPIPIDLNLRLQNEQPLTGTIQVASFPLELFRRDASVERIDIRFKPIASSTQPEEKTGPQTTTSLNGSVKVSYADYTIRVLLLNTLDQPRITLTSDPPLPEDQLVAVLFFGQPLEQLDPMQSKSVGDVHSALADGAVNLLSLYVLASTPIQSVGYDSTTGTFTAKVKLGEGTSLNVGSDPSQVREIGIQKRLSRFWTIMTELSHPTNPDERSLSAFLQWSNRY